MKSERHVQSNIVKSGTKKQLDQSTKQSDTSTKKYNPRNWKATMKQLHVWIKINKLRVRMILTAKKRLQENKNINKRNGMVMFVYRNAVNYYAL